MAEAETFQRLDEGPITKPKVLLGEGFDELRFFEALLRHLKIDDVHVGQYRGKNKLRKGLQALVRRSGFRKNVVSLGVTRDADFLKDSEATGETVETAAFQSVCSALEAAKLPVPESIESRTETKPIVSVFVFPGNGRKGMLENLCLDSVHDDAAFKCIGQFFECVDQQTGQCPTQEAKSKAEVHAWLATRRPPDLRLGESAQRGLWQLDHPAFLGFTEFVRSI